MYGRQMTLSPEDVFCAPSCYCKVVINTEVNWSSIVNTHGSLGNQVSGILEQKAEKTVGWAVVGLGGGGGPQTHTARQKRGVAAPPPCEGRRLCLAAGAVRWPPLPDAAARPSRHGYALVFIRLDGAAQTDSDARTLRVVLTGHCPPRRALVHLSQGAAEGAEQICPMVHTVLSSG
ncbi:hypothetical protein MHYP_G00195590 [Metynnis hypsauchen]